MTFTHTHTHSWNVCVHALEEMLGKGFIERHRVQSALSIKVFGVWVGGVCVCVWTTLTRVARGVIKRLRYTYLSDRGHLRTATSSNLPMIE